MNDSTKCAVSLNPSPSVLLEWITGLRPIIFSLSQLPMYELWLPLSSHPFTLKTHPQIIWLLPVLPFLEVNCICIHQQFNASYSGGDKCLFQFNSSIKYIFLYFLLCPLKPLCVVENKLYPKIEMRIP